MRTIQFSVSEPQYQEILRQAYEVGLTGAYAASTYARMATIQLCGGAVDIAKNTVATLVSMKASTYWVLQEYATRKGFRGPDQVAAFLYKSGFDIMAKYPLRGRAKE